MLSVNNSKQIKYSIGSQNVADVKQELKNFLSQNKLYYYSIKTKV
jgi:hypothetical protein